LPNISKTFASKQDVWDKTPDPAVREMILRMEQIGCDTTFDRFDKQKPQCTFGLAGVVAADIATDVLFGIGHRATSKVNVGALKKGYVNIAVHGHLPTLVSEIVRIGRTQEFIDMAKAHGAEGIHFYGVCCSCLSAMKALFHCPMPLVPN